VPPIRATARDVRERKVRRRRQPQDVPRMSTPGPGNAARHGDLAKLGPLIEVSKGSRDSGLTQPGLVEAIHGVIDALRRAQVDTLVLVDQPTSRVHAWVGPWATELARDADELKDLGVDSPQPDRLDATMVRALAGTSASLLTARRRTCPCPTARAPCSGPPTFRPGVSCWGFQRASDGESWPRDHGGALRSGHGKPA
jgi:hypothetical protein